MLETIKNFLGSLGLVIAILLSWLLVALSSFKMRQTDGKSYVNDVFTDLGEGNFTDTITNPVKKFFWLITWFVSVGFAIYFSFLGFAKFVGSENTNQSTSNDVQINSSTSSKTQPEDKSTESKDLSRNEKTPQATDAGNNSNTNTDNNKEKVTTQGADKKSELSEEEIRKLEEEKGYSGNDPVIRMRLGLPPKQ